MSATTVGALIGGAIDGLSGEDGVADGALIGAGVANVLKVVAPLVVTYAIGWAVLRGVGALKDGIFRQQEAQR